MASAKKTKNAVAKMSFTVGAEMDQRLWVEMVNAQNQTRTNGPTDGRSHIGRTIMRRRIIKFVAAAAIVAVALLGLFEFIGTGSTSGVVWAEVVQRIQASQATIYRTRDIQNLAVEPAGEVEQYEMWYRCPDHTRVDNYEAGEIQSSLFIDYNSRSITNLMYSAKCYFRQTMSEAHAAKAGPADPLAFVAKFLSTGHQELGRKVIDSVPCEGIETTDSSIVEANYNIDSFVGRLWVSIETEYPVLLEAEVVGNGGQIHSKRIIDRFQWDVDLDPDMFEANIPSDYTQLN